MKQISHSEFVHDARVMWISQKALFRRPKKQISIYTQMKEFP